MNNNNTDQSYEKDIDLVYIFKSIKNGFLNLLRSIGKLIRFSFQNAKKLLIFAIIGGSLGAGFFFIKKPIYNSSLTMSHTRLNSSQCEDLVNILTKNSSKDTLLASNLGISIKDAKQIKGIFFKQIVKAAENDSLSRFYDFKIEVKVSDASILDTLQKKILNFLESNEYALKRKNINKLFLDNYEQKLKGEILSIDSLKLIVAKSILPRSLGNGIILGESIDPVKIYQEGMNLYRSQLNINELRELNNSFEIIVGFSPATPSSNLLINILLGVIFSLISGLIWLSGQTGQNKLKAKF